MDRKQMQLKLGQHRVRLVRLQRRTRKLLALVGEMQVEARRREHIAPVLRLAS
jgi:hypothetical protein